MGVTKHTIDIPTPGDAVSAQWAEEMTKLANRQHTTGGKGVLVSYDDNNTNITAAPVPGKGQPLPKLFEIRTFRIGENAHGFDPDALGLYAYVGDNADEIVFRNAAPLPRFDPAPSITTNGWSAAVASVTPGLVLYFYVVQHFKVGSWVWELQHSSDLQTTTLDLYNTATYIGGFVDGEIIQAHTGYIQTFFGAAIPAVIQSGNATSGYAATLYAGGVGLPDTGEGTVFLTDVHADTEDDLLVGTTVLAHPIMTEAYGGSESS